VPRAKLEELKGFLTTSSVADALGLSAYLIKARIADGTLPPASKTSEAGVLLFDDAWMATARDVLASAPQRRRRRDARVSTRIPSPERVLGHRMGEAGWLPEWDDILRYFRELDAASGRVSVDVLGESTSGKPYIVVAVSAPENLQPSARERNRQLLGRLWDPRDLGDDETDLILTEARSVGVILATQHSTEIGAALMTLQLAYELASADDADTLEILGNTIALLIPSHNPDGVQMIAEWYQRWAGTGFEGADLPFLYHPYTGHDNNRDWFMMTQDETRLYVDLHNREHPQAVFDMHQMGRLGPRYMVPPFIDPLDPNQDPVIQNGFAALGTHIAQRLTAEGKAGVVTHAIFDNYSPSLAYGNYHGSVDLLSEAASTRLATPVTLTEDELTGEHGFDPKQRLWNQPMPWKGGEWTLDAIVDYNRIAARAFLEHLARNRRQWLVDYLGINRRTSTRTEKPYGFVIPAAQRDPGTAAELLEILQRGLVEVHEAIADMVIDGVTWPAGTRIVSLNQPAGTFAKTLLEVQKYPDLRQWPDGPPSHPYDIAGHTLPIQMGVRAVPIEKPLADDLALKLLEGPVDYQGRVTGPARGVKAWVFDERSNASMAAVIDLLAEEVPVYRAREANAALGIRPGSIIVPASDDRRSLIQEISQGTGADVVAVDAPVDIAAWRQARVRLGVYKPWTATIDEGWARWVLEEFAVDYETLETPDIRQGGLRGRFDVILLPQMKAEELRDGLPEKTRYKDPNPPEYVGGLGSLGMDALREFAATGGTLIGIDHVSQALIEGFALPVRNALKDKPQEEFFCPGSLLQVVVDTKHPLGYGLPRETAVLFIESMAFETAGTDVTTVATYPSSNPNLSGWILGSEHLERRGALVDVRYGEGSVVLVGFRPYFRAQSRGTYKVLFNAIARAGYVEEQLTLS
jgi:hypothetical protein